MGVPSDFRHKHRSAMGIWVGGCVGGWIDGWMDRIGV